MEKFIMKIFINYQLTNAFRVVQSRDKISGVKHMIHGGMEPIKATHFIEAMSKDIADNWQAQKAFCLTRKSTYKSYDTAILHGFRWYEIL